MRSASTYAQEGRRIVVDLDLEKFFDKVNHDVLMARLKRKISDKRLLYYICQMLKAAAKRVLNSVTRYLENTLKLKVNGEKSKVVSACECPYLGYIIGTAGALRVGKEKVATIQDQRVPPSHGKGVVQETGVSLIAERSL